MNFGLPTNALHHFLSHFINSLQDCIQFTIWKCHLLQNKPAPWMTAGYLSICCFNKLHRTSTTSMGRANISRKWWNHLILALGCTLGNCLIHHFQGGFSEILVLGDDNKDSMFKIDENFLQSLIHLRKLGNNTKW